MHQNVPMNLCIRVAVKDVCFTSVLWLNFLSREQFGSICCQLTLLCIEMSAWVPAVCGIGRNMGEQQHVWSAAQWPKSSRLMCLSKMTKRVTEKLQFTLKLDTMPCRRSYWLSHTGRVVIGFPTCLDTVTCRRSYWLWDAGKVVSGLPTCQEEQKRAHTSLADQCVERPAAKGDYLLLNMWLMMKVDFTISTPKQGNSIWNGITSYI